MTDIEIILLGIISGIGIVSICVFLGWKIGENRGKMVC